MERYLQRDANPDGTPGVVSVTRALGATGFASAVTGPFDVRIILTEEPLAFTADHIIVENGTNSAPVAGSPIEGGYTTADNRAPPAAMAIWMLSYAGGGWAMHLMPICPMPRVEITSIISTW